MPQTVPKRPMNGVAEAQVARKPFRRSKRVISWLDARSSARCRLSVSIFSSFWPLPVCWEISR